MEFQLHPASSRGTVRSIQWGRRGELWAAAAAGVAAAMAVSLWITVPVLAARSLRAIRARAQSDTRSDLTARREWRDLEARAGAVRDRALDAGDRLSRIAFLYGVPVASWPRGLNPETGLLSGDAPAAIGSAGERYLANLERGRDLLEAVEAKDGGLAIRTPSRLPLRSELVEPSAYFGPRVSPWTRAEEFFPGIELAAPAGSEVIAPAEGVVIFVGHSPARPNSRLSRLGNLVVLRHGAAGVTLYGHLKLFEVRKGERVRRGQRLGTVGSTGWAVSPGLHYEYWRGAEGRLAPTDPQFAILDRRMGRREASLEKMLATSAAGPLEPPPGL